MFRSRPYLEFLRSRTGLSGSYDIALDQALNHPRLLVVGPAGSGKTTFLGHLAYLWAGGILDVRGDHLVFPVLLRGRDLSAHLGEDSGLEDPSRWLSGILSAHSRDGCWGLDQEFFRVRLARGGCLILVDAWDEIPAAGRQAVSRMLASLATAGPFARVVVATRPEARPVLPGFVTVEVGRPES